ncbi:MAG TPA: methylmalonyl-CoA mutase family protein, partial [Phototrophicaceae bacterium]|nr:methylmalonyl-CoA mutase family protein [Phototrophicaceae bacterium]
THQRTLVGVNKYVSEEAPRIPILQMDPHGYERQVARLQKLRQERDNPAVERSLNALRTACAGTANTMPYLLDCARAYCTLSEITDVMREVFGVYHERALV